MAAENKTHMTENERTLLPQIVAEAAKLSLLGQAEALGWLKCKAADKKEGA